MTTSTTTLSRDDIATFHHRGYLGPFELCSPEEMAGLRARIEAEVLPTTGPNPTKPVQARHLDHRVVYDLVSHPAVIDRLRGLMGDDILVWTSFFFSKEPGGSEIPWHQDAHYWPIEPPINFSMWLAIDEVTTENSCVQLIPGSHRSVVPHVPSRDGMAFGEEADPAHVDASRAMDMELQPGEFFLFNERMLHHSEPNRSQKRRMGLSARYTLPIVEILDQDSAPLFPGSACMLVSGQDRLELNRMTTAPTGP